MDAKPALVEVGQALKHVNLDAVLIGNAAAALQGAPVTTIDFDFLFRSTPRNLAKLKALADRLRATVLRPYYPASGLFRVTRDDDGLQVDFMTSIHGVKSFEGVRDRATRMDIDGTTVLVASLDDVIRSKKAARRPRDLAVIEVLERAREAKAREAGAKAPPRRTRPRK
jgi:hypothetical protein